MTHRHRIPLALALIVLGSAPRAGAQPADASSTAVAVELFDEAERLMASGRASEACPKYAESYRLDPQVGVLLYLGECYEKATKLASAWATFRNAEEVARKRGDERAGAARERADALEPRLSRLVIRVPEPQAGLTIVRNCEPVAEALWGSAVAVDPGVHVVEAQAPGAERFVRQIEVSGEGNVVEVAIPVATQVPVATQDEAPSSQAAAPPSSAPAPREERSRFTTPVLVAAGATLVLAAGTAVTGVMYLGKRDEFHDANAGPSPVAEKQAQRDDASTLGLVSTLLGAATAVGAGVTTVLFLAADPSSEQPASASPGLRVLPWAAPGSAGIALGGSL